MLSRLVFAFAVFAAGMATAAPTCLGPTPYVKKADSPFDLSHVGTTFFFDDFESDTRTAGVTPSSGTRIGPMQSAIVDSVDEDDGTIDGSGLQGHSWFGSPGSDGIRFTFDAQTLGGLPTAAGIVWTDGDGTVSFEAVAGDGMTVICASGPVSDPGVFPDASSAGGTSEDRFFGVYEPTGISSIFISNTGGGIEVDHLQFGLVGLAGTCTAAPTFDSILCRIDALAGDVATADLGRLSGGIAQALAKARKQVVKAQGGSGKVGKNQLKKAAKSLDSFRHKLDSNNAKHLITKATRDDLRGQAEAIRGDVNAFRGTL